MAKIKELEARKGFDEITAEVISKSDARDVRNGELKVADAEIKDDSGSIKLTLWNDEIEKVQSGDIVKITKGWVNEFQGNLSVSAGKFGTLEVIDKKDNNSDSDKKPETVPEEVKLAIDNEII